MSIDDQLIEARGLIQQKKYAEARAMLVGLDHPTAREWVDKIDDLGSKPKREMDDSPSTKPKRSWKRRAVIWGVGIFVGLIVISQIMVAVGVIPDAGERDETATAEAVAQVAIDQTNVALTPSATLTMTATVTDTPTITATASVTSLPTMTHTPMPSATVTETPLPSATATIPPTPSEDEVALEIIERVVTGEVLSVRFAPFLGIVADFDMAQTFGYEVNFTRSEMVELACELREVFPETRMVFNAHFDVIDGFGNESSRTGMQAVLEAGTADQINCENAIMLDIDNIADSYTLDELLSD